MRAWENADFGLGKKSPKTDFGLTRKMGKKSPKNRKNGSKIGFRAIFPIFWRFFPHFPGEAKIDFSAILFRNRHSPGHAYSQPYSNGAVQIRSWVWSSLKSWEEPSMDQDQSRGKRLTNFQRHWSIRISLNTRQRWAKSPIANR